MVARKTFFIGLVAAFLAGSLIGLAAGAFGGYRAGMGLILNDALAKDAREVGAHIATLNLLWDGEKGQAIQKLEGGLDDILVRFDPDQPYAGLDQSVVASLAKAIGQAKAYRAVHPWPSTEKHPRAEMVRSLFARDLYKPAVAERRP